MGRKFKRKIFDETKTGCLEDVGEYYIDREKGNHEILSEIT